MNRVPAEIHAAPEGFECATLDDFRRHAREFHESMCNREVMSDNKRRAALFKGFAIVYLHTDFEGAEQAQALQLFESMSLEFTMRMRYFV